jgi:hypothetical protein
MIFFWIRTKRKSLDEGIIKPKPLRKKGLCRMLYFPPHFFFALILWLENKHELISILLFFLKK